jgi:hypothetical protein
MLVTPALTLPSMNLRERLELRSLHLEPISLPQRGAEHSDRDLLEESYERFLASVTA